MRSKKKDKEKKYIAGGMFVLPALQAGLGAYQMIQGNKMANALEEPSLSKPSEYADMLKLAQNQQVEDKRLENLNRSISTGMAAAQAGGGRALVGALPGMVRAGDKGSIDILAKRQADQMAALRAGAMGSEREIGRNVSKYRMDLGAAQAAIEGGLQNIGGAVGQAGQAMLLADRNKITNTIEDPLKGLATTDGMEAGRRSITEGIESDLDARLAQEAVLGKAPNTKPTLLDNITSNQVEIPEILDDAEGMDAGKVKLLFGDREKAFLKDPRFGEGSDLQDYYKQLNEDAFKSDFLKVLDSYPESEIPTIEDIEGKIKLIPESAKSIAAKDKILQEELNKTRFLEDGGKMTKGSFNHKTNPINIVQKGVKVGEMTGGEVILNPKQQAKLSKESSYFRNLLKKFNKNK
tara:strand:- start:3090 stop:4310 length:1221 start_codon:yes stop_codon:yes gene_type:complete